MNACLLVSGQMALGLLRLLVGGEVLLGGAAGIGQSAAPYRRTAHGRRVIVYLILAALHGEVSRTFMVIMAGFAVPLALITLLIGVVRSLNIFRRRARELEL